MSQRAQYRKGTNTEAERTGHRLLRWLDGEAYAKCNIRITTYYFEEGFYGEGIFY